MSAFWTMRRIRDALPSIRLANGLSMAMRAYFDDSGTHAGASVFLWAGLVGKDEQWGRFDAAWPLVLDKYGLQSFHMAECEAGYDPYFFKRSARDALIHDLRQCVIDAGLTGVATAVVRQAWEALVDNELHAAIGGMGTACLALCIKQAQDVALGGADTDPVHIVFDGGVPEQARIAVSEMGEVFNAEHGRDDYFTHGSVKQTSGLQAADMFAWELNLFLRELVEKGEPLVRPHFRAWRPTNSSFILYDRQEIEALIQSEEVQERLKVLRSSSAGQSS